MKKNIEYVISEGWEKLFKEMAERRKKNPPFKVGEKVRLKHPIDKKYVNGIIENINGAYIYIRMKYRNILTERYPNEIERP